MSENEAAMDTMKKNTPEWSQRVLSQEMLRETRRRKADKEKNWQRHTGEMEMPYLGSIFLSHSCVPPIVSSAPFFYLDKQGLTKHMQNCLLASFPEPQGTMQRCLVTLLFPLNCLVLFGVLVRQVSLLTALTHLV